jgi:hypothetical protein
MREERVATPFWIRALVWLVVPALGAALLLGVERLADEVVRLSWVPFKGPFELIHDVPGPYASIGALVLGGLAGLVLAGLIDAESMTVRLSGTEVTLQRPGTTRTVPRADVAVAFADKDKLVLLGRTGRELAREPSHLTAKRLAPAFAAQGIAWSDRDPYEDAYRRWIPGLPDVPAAAAAVFAARQTAIKGGDERDIKELREELARLGFVVRDERKRQFWRRVDG